MPRAESPPPGQNSLPPGQNRYVEIAEHIDALRDQGALLAGAAERAGLDTAVPPCPSWAVKDLLRHTGYIHRWAARHITECPPNVLDGPSEAEILRGGAPDRDLIAWFLAGHAALVGTLAAADPALECATFMDAPSPLAFWARRQAHETAIHRADAESAVGATPDYPAEFAVDGIDELIMGFLARDEARLSPQQLAGPRQVLAVRATDTGGSWLVGLTADGRDAARVARGGGPAGCTLAGPSAGLYQLLWNRCDLAGSGAEVTGDAAILAAWSDGIRVTWS